MDDYNRNPMMPPEDSGGPSVVGGLAERVGGGLSQFFDNVNKGVEKVLSHPLYARAWSGMVSAQAGDPMAGPMALQQLRQSTLDQRMQRQEMDLQREQSDTARHNAMLRERDMQRLRAALATGDPQTIRNVYGDVDPVGGTKLALTPPASAKPVQVMREGKPVYVSPADAIGMEPVPRAPLVQINDALKPEQVLMAEDRAASRVDSKAQPLEVALDAYRSFRALADQVAARGTPPTPAETDSLAKLAARLENPEAVQEGDIARKAGGSLANFFAGKAGLPYTLNMDQLSGLVSTADTIAAEKQRRLDEIYSGAKGVAAGRGLNPEAVTPGAQQAVQSKPPSDAPAGSMQHPTIPGLWVAPDGSVWRH